VNPSLDTTAERPLLEGWIEGFSKVFGEGPRIEPMASPIAGGPDDLFQLVFPRVFDRLDLIGNSGHFGGCAPMVEHVRRLGFDWGDDEKVLTVPTPATFNRLLGLLGVEGAGYHVSYYVEDAGRFSLGPWLRNYLDGTLPIHVGNPEYYRRVLSRGGADSMSFHFASFAHDLSVHALNYHLVPRSAIEAMREQIREAVGARWSDWEAPDADAPLTLTFFLDNDLNRYCYQVWFQARSPEHYVKLFTTHQSQLTDALAIRIAETLEGKGDVPSGDTGDMPPLRPTEFRIDRPD